MDWKSFDIFFLWLCLLLSSDLPACTAYCESGEGKKCFAILGFLFFQQVGTDCTVPSNHVRLRRIRPFRHLIPQVPYCTYSSDDVLLLMMMIHNLLDLIRRARTLWFMVHGSILLY